MHPRSLFSLAEHLERLSKDGDPLEVLAATVEFERFRPLLIKWLGCPARARANSSWAESRGIPFELIV